MKRLITISLLIVVINTTLYSHEDSFIAIEESNLHIKAQVGYEWSLQLKIIRAYAPIINEFIRDINPNEKVFIQFEEDYCYFGTNCAYLTYGDFKDFIVPGGFPFRLNYDMTFINNESGLAILVADKYFKVKPILQMIEYGLRNKDTVKENSNQLAEFSIPISINATKEQRAELLKIIPKVKFKVMDEALLKNILKSEETSLLQKYLDKTLPVKDFSETLDSRDINVYLQNDSICFYKQGKKLLTISTIDFFASDENRKSLFVFDTNKSFYYLSPEHETNHRKYHLSFALDCLHWLRITYQPVNQRYLMGKVYWIIPRDFEYEFYNYFYPYKEKVTN